MRADSRSQQPPRRARAPCRCWAPRGTLGVVGAAHTPRGRLRPRPAPAPRGARCPEAAVTGEASAGAAPAPPGPVRPCPRAEPRPAAGDTPRPGRRPACAVSPASVALSPPRHRVPRHLHGTRSGQGMPSPGAPSRELRGQEGPVPCAITPAFGTPR